MVHLWNEKKELLEEFSTHERTLVVSLEIEDSVQHVGQSYCAIVIAAKGDFCYRIFSQMEKEIESLLPALSLCQSLSGRGCPHKLLHATPFQLSFEFHEKSGILKDDCLAVKQFIHRISLVHTMIKFHYCVKVNNLVSAETYSTERRDSACLPDGTRLVTDGRHFVRPESSETKNSCNKVHPMSGESVGLFIPSEVAEKGFSGDMRLMPVVSLCPCQKKIPNQPVTIAALSIFLYDPAGLPILLPATEIAHSFLKDPSLLAAWERYGYQAILNADPQWNKDTARPDVRYKLYTSHKQSSESEEQTLLLFLFLSYSDPFQDKPAYNFWDRQVILSHLYPILMYSEQAVKGTIQGVLNRVLEQHHKVVCPEALQMETFSLTPKHLLGGGASQEKAVRVPELSRQGVTPTGDRKQRKKLDSASLSTQWESPSQDALFTSEQKELSREQQKLASSLSIMVEAISTIISSSTDCEFRRRCFQHLQVADTQQFLAAVEKAFSNVSLQRWKPSSMRDSQRPLLKKDGVEQLSIDSALPSVCQHSSSCISSAGLEQEGSCEGEGFLLDRSEFEGMRQIKRSRSSSKEICWEDLRDLNTSGKSEAHGRDTGLFIEPGTTLNSSIPHLANTRPEVFLIKSQEGTTALSVSNSGSNENLYQNDDVWNQEISNLAEWTS